MYKNSLNTRLYLVFLFFILFFSLLTIRLVYVQVFNSSELKTLANAQHKIFTEIPPQRGTIFDRRLKELAVNVISYSIFATSKVAVEDGIIDSLSSILKTDKNSLLNKLNKDRNFVWLKRKADPETVAKLKELNIPGIGQIREYKRFYPNGPLASHILGFTDVDNKGLEGIELYCDSYLAGIKGWRLAQRDARRQELICWGYKSILPTDGYNVILTLDSVVQDITERYLKEAVRKYKATSATAIVIEPASGEILALANYPDYDVNYFNDYQEYTRRNLAITDIFEPGSSFKFVTAAAALEENKVKLEDKFYCEKGNYAVAGRILHDYRPYGELSFQAVIEHSSNIGTVKVAQLLGEQLLYKYMKNFGFGRITEIDLPGEVKGTLRPPDKWSRLSISSIPMGQEIAVTPIQLICAVSCVANDGILIKPKMIKLIQRKDGQILKSFPTQQVSRVVSAETARALKQILVGVVENGSGKKAKVSRYKTAGKTGTAQKARPEGGYYKDKYVASFVGFLPADEPALAILVVLNEPRGQHLGGQVAAPVFRNIATEALKYLEMPKESLSMSFKR